MLVPSDVTQEWGNVFVWRCRRNFCAKTLHRCNYLCIVIEHQLGGWVDDTAFHIELRYNGLNRIISRGNDCSLLTAKDIKSFLP